MRIILAEDSALLREGLKMVLTHLGHTIVAEAATAPDLQDAYARVGTHEVDLVITDVRMPPTNTSDGLQVALTLREENPNTPILVLSQYIASAYARELFAAGANGLGYLLKDRVSNIEDFARAITTIADGGTVVDPDVIAHLMRPQTPDTDKLAALTNREKEILALMAQGKSNTDIETELFVSSATVAKHIGNIFDKLGLAPDAGNRRVRAVLTFLDAS
ncbi:MULTISPECIES: response regulator transcription factor [unclassified Rothia (in: high G+C Gram-positive bacteria)]|uniref:response regulator transcription factor n=1 Tax=unclassified Rothia (in: high G+C Gram-positive bacteria) TaxID=2689056 RepID=UPI00195A5398|nr:MULTISPECIES: response regulator transcription factor [unclassified Rothia (in: high G+C Gram-positive bacteria)]MBM7052129.1 response regulator transcription factor [Rothia sp. ZJ1223]QRZ61437.1 response regulator transcription factor [Rothia sp. ZJ932]